MSSAVSGVMSVVLFAGGAMGYFKKGSKPSLIAGALFGAIYAYCALQGKKNPTVVVPLQLATSALLTVMMGVRFVKSNFEAVFPAGVLTVAGLASGAFYYVNTAM